MMNQFNVNLCNYETMTILDAKEAVSTAAKVYFLQDEQGNYRVKTRRARPLCLMGPAGIGKTEIVAQVAQEQDLAFCSYSLVHHTRQSLLGLPRLHDQEWGEETVSCTRYTMSEIVDEIHQTMEKTGKEQGILFLDEFNCASESIRPVMLQLLQEKTLGTHKIPDGWMLVLAGNPMKYNKSAKELDPVTLDRLRMLHVEANLDVWMTYGKKSGIHPVVLSFLEEYPDCFYRYEGGNSSASKDLVTARGWEDLSIQIQMMEEIGEPVTSIFIGQFLQSTHVVHNFFVYYRRFSTMNSTGLMERVKERNPNCIEEIKALNVQDRWAMVTSVVTRIKSVTEQVTKEEQILDRIYVSLKEKRELLKEGPATAITTLHSIADNMVFDTEVEEAILRCANTIQGDDAWESITNYFQQEWVNPVQKARQDAITHIDNMLFICNEAITDAENTERILHSLVADDTTSNFIASGEFPAFRTLCANTNFDGSSILRNMNQKAS